MDSIIRDFMQFWGKAQPLEPSSVSWHPLAWHSLDVAAVAEVLLERENAIAVELATRMAADVAAAGRFLVCLTALHDIGKFSLGFQAKAPPCFPSSLIFPTIPKIGDHPAIGHRMLGEPEFAPLWDRLAPNLGETARGTLAGALAGHHGRPAVPLMNWVADEIGRKAVAAAWAFFADVTDLLAREALPGRLDERSARTFSWRLAGFVNLADWIGSNQHVFRYESSDIDMADYWQRIARPRARQAVAAAGLGPNPVSTASGFAALTGRLETPSPLQAHCEAIDGLGGGPTFFLIEDMTGAGKTEAALILAHRLMQAGAAYRFEWAESHQQTESVKGRKADPLAERSPRQRCRSIAA